MNISDDQFIAAVQANTSMAATLRAVGLVPAGGNYASGSAALVLMCPTGWDKHTREVKHARAC